MLLQLTAVALRFDIWRRPPFHLFLQQVYHGHSTSRIRHYGLCLRVQQTPGCYTQPGVLRLSWLLRLIYLRMSGRYSRRAALPTLSARLACTGDAPPITVAID